MQDHYAVLELPRSVTPEQLRSRYKQLVRIYHPDRFTGSADKAYAEERFKLINQAYSAIYATLQGNQSPRQEEEPNTPTIPPQATLTVRRALGPLVTMRRRTQQVVITGGILLAGLAATPRLLLLSTGFNQPLPINQVALVQPAVRTEITAAITDQAPTDWVPVTSPNGRQMVFILRKTDTEQLYIRDRRNGRLRAVTENPIRSASLVWSPDENKLAFLANAAGHEQIFILDLQTLQLESLAAITEESELRTLAWSTADLTSQ